VLRGNDRNFVQGYVPVPFPGQSLQAAAGGNAVTLSIPSTAPYKIATVVAVEIDGPILPN